MPVLLCWSASWCAGLLQSGLFSLLLPSLSENTRGWSLRRFLLEHRVYTRLGAVCGWCSYPFGVSKWCPGPTRGGVFFDWCTSAGASVVQRVARMLPCADAISACIERSNGVFLLRARILLGPEFWRCYEYGETYRAGSLATRSDLASCLHRSVEMFWMNWSVFESNGLINDNWILSWILSFDCISLGMCALHWVRCYRCCSDARVHLHICGRNQIVLLVQII